MKDVKRKYLKLLAIELEDLKEDIEGLVQETEQRMRADRISPYVCFENLAVLKNEILDIETVSGILNEVRSEDYDSLDALVVGVESRFRVTLREYIFAEAAMRLIRRKLEKVAEYLRVAG